MNRMLSRSACATAAMLFGIALSLAAADNDGSPIVTEAMNPKLKSPITLWAKDASLSEVLKVLAERSEMNFVAGEGVHRERITIILNKTPLDEAINLLVRAAGLSYEIIGNSVLIAETGKLREEVGQSAYVVELKYARAEEVANALSDLTKNVKIDEGGNRLICYTSPRVINEIEKIVLAIDHPHILVMLETRLIEVSAEDLDQYGIRWGDFSPISTGVRYPQSPLTDGFNVDNWLQLETRVDVILDMLLSNDDARLLMDSKLTTTNNREAELHIGEVVPYTIQSYNLSASGGVNQQIEKEEVGVKVKMTPHINEDNQITLSLEPEVSNIAEFKGPGADLPLVRVRKASTTIRVENGQTVFLAGLLSEETTESIRKLPLLGDIPILGLLFQHRKKEVSKKSLIIEITPRIIYDTKDLSTGSDFRKFDSTTGQQGESEPQE
ncbi:MAG: hypothetical protein GF418_08880 [Chitinivibrionales bacterium]|nr:hypothetical protein [Chitinivibrionales bacterium]MBD3395727.1 hypothetical protein [Chitinivibrionales bacterium]